MGQTYAIFVVLIAIPFYGETVGICRFITVIFGFSAVLSIMQPGTFFCLELLVANWCRLCYATLIVCLRNFGEVSNSFLYLYSASVAAASALVGALGTTEFLPIASLLVCFSS